MCLDAGQAAARRRGAVSGLELVFRASRRGAERAARASTPGVQAELANHPRTLGREAKAKMRQLQRNRPKSEDLEELQQWEEEVLVIKEELGKSDDTRLAFGFPFVDANGVWQNLRTHTPANIFEEVLIRTLAELGLNPGQVKSIVHRGTRPVLRRRAAPGPCGPAPSAANRAIAGVTVSAANRAIAGVAGDGRARS